MRYGASLLVCGQISYHYTITRAEEKVVLIGSEKTINESINSFHAEHRKADLVNEILKLSI
ncbi:MAG: hypothetical protein ACI88H_001216 [Cocleimonas sp.]|jgi:hypothetical protein